MAENNTTAAPIILNGNVFGNKLPTTNLTEGRVFYLKVPEDNKD